MLLGFKSRFESAIVAKTKRHTIRGKRKNAPKVGETCHCYVNPRQKTMRLLGRWLCVKVQDITIIRRVSDAHAPLCVIIDGTELDDPEANHFFYSDGFQDEGGETYTYMWQAAEFWEKNNGLTEGKAFHGDVIHWNPERQL